MLTSVVLALSAILFFVLSISVYNTAVQKHYFHISCNGSFSTHKAGRAIANLEKWYNSLLIAAIGCFILGVANGMIYDIAFQMQSYEVFGYIAALTLVACFFTLMFKILCWEKKWLTVGALALIALGILIGFKLS